MVQDTSQVVSILPEAKDLVNNLLILLSPKEKHIIENRYSLNNRLMPLWKKSVVNLT